MVKCWRLFLKSKIYKRWRKRLVFSKSLFFIWCLALSCSFVEYRVVAVLIDVITKQWKEDNLRKAAIITMWQEGLSSVCVIYTHVLQAYTGRFSVIISGTATHVMGLMLFWVSYLDSMNVGILMYVAVTLIALGNAGLTALEAFLGYQLKEIVRGRTRTRVNQKTQQSTEEKKDHDVRVTIWWRSARILGAVIATFSPEETNWSDTLKHAVLAMVSAYLLFCFGYIFYVFEEPNRSPVTKIYKVFKAAFWKNHGPDHAVHTYRNIRTNQFHLLPRVSLLWRWLDKPAIIRVAQQPNPGINGDLCTVKQVMEGKRFASLIQMLFTLLPYSMVMSAGSTFFVEQTSNLMDTFPIAGLFLLKSITRDLVLFLIWLKKFTRRREMTIVRVGAGMICSVLCCLTAWLVERRRLSLINEKEISMGMAVLVPQYFLLGLMEALADCGLENLFCNYAPKSMWSLGEPFSEFILGMGKLLTIPFVAFSTGWFKSNMNDSHLDRYYLMLAVLNFVFVIIYGDCFIKYEGNWPEDELRTVEMQNIGNGSHQARQAKEHGT